MIQIAEAKQTHIPEIIEIWKELMDFHSEINPFFTRNDDGHHSFEKYIKESINSKKSQVLVALDGKKVVAYSLSNVAYYPPVFENTIYGFISDIAVKKECQRQGIGECLLDEIKKWFSQQGITRIELQAASGNKVACSFWKKQGFREYKYVMYLET